jgi:hypothetical protein
MSLPGYAAEASVYRSSGRYRAAMTAGGLPLGGVAVPQQAELLPPFPFFCFPPVCPPGGVQTCCLFTPFGGYRCFTRQCPYPPGCQGLAGCELFRCECATVHHGILGPPRPGFPCGTCIHI